MQDPYEVLGIRRSAGAAEIDLAYKARRTQYHPDKYSASDAETLRWATTRMQEVNAAYAVLSDEHQRARFDAQSGQAEPPEPENPEARDTSASLRALLHQHLAPFGRFSRTFFAPDIPLKKLSAALQNYGGSVKAQDVLALVDTTIFGGSKEGILLTERQMRIKEIGTPVRVFEWQEVTTVEAAERTVYVDSRKVLECHMVETHELRSLFKVVAEFLSPVSASKGHHTGPAQSRGGEDVRQAQAAKGRGERAFRDAKQKLIDLYRRLAQFEDQNHPLVDRVEAAKHFEQLEACLAHPRSAEIARTELDLIASLCDHVMAVATATVDLDAVHVRDCSDDSQVVSELRAVLFVVAQERRRKDARPSADGFFARS
jgi:hypothetical protein